MKTKVIVLMTAAVMAASCTPSVEEESIELAALAQTQQQSKNDSLNQAMSLTASDSYGDETIGYSQQSEMQQEGVSGNETTDYVQQSGMQQEDITINVTGNFLIESISNPDASMLSTMKVTVSKVEIRIDNGDGSLVLYPALSSSVENQEKPSSWSRLPEGLGMGKKSLLDEPVRFSCKRYADIRVTVYYTVSVKDDNLAGGIFSTKGMLQVSDWVMASQKNVDLNVCILLSPVLFDASVSNWG